MSKHKFRLPIIMPEIKGQKFSCQGCGNCCRELVVHLTPADRTKIDDAGWKEKIGVEPYVRLQGGYVLNHAPNGDCVFLMDDRRCRIHAELGGAEKPLTCRLFPFTFEREAGHVRTGIRFDCPTVTKNEGTPIETHQKELNRLAGELDSALPSLFRETDEQVEFTNGFFVERQTVDKIIDACDRWLSREDLPIRSRLLSFCLMLLNLHFAKYQRFDDEKLIELVRMLIDDLPNAAKDGPPVPEGPTKKQRKLFMQSIFAHSEYANFEYAKNSDGPSLGLRWRQLKRAMHTANGRGVIPDFACGASRGTFEELDALQPSSNLNFGDVDALLTRYLQYRISSHASFGRTYYNWPVLPGLCSATQSVAVIGWFARWSALRESKREFELSDMRRAVQIVDRAAGRSPELGAKTAYMRVRYQAETQGLAPLLERYRLW